MPDREWRKSSFSSGDPNANCIEVAHAAEDRLYLRESEEPGVVLTTTPTRLAALLRCLRARVASS
ncbi:DUF397 domain-containing protein [Streptomyces sp. 4N509B]|uniref:DUF397 domain-containing protein n=1 Tax=Streptomyces sp. 4N509B TaxID=3457413 RepID=UPI003FD57FF7